MFPTFLSFKKQLKPVFNGSRQPWGRVVQTDAAKPKVDGIYNLTGEGPREGEERRNRDKGQNLLGKFLCNVFTF